MARLFLSLAALGGFLAVALGAFGAHALRESLDAYSLSIFEIAVRYQFYHALALFGLGLICRHEFGQGDSTGQDRPGQDRLLAMSGYGFVIGMVIFSGSLYLLAFTGQRWLGAITPIGGLGFLVGWAALARWAIKRPVNHD